MTKLRSVAICGAHTTLGKALREKMRRMGVETVDVCDADLKLPAPSLAERIAGVDGVFNLDGEPYVARWGGRYEFDIYRSHQMSVRSLGNALRFADPRPEFFVTLSNAMVYDKFEVHDEYSNAYGDSFMAEVGQMETAEAMRIVKHSGGGLRLIVARAGYLMSRDGGAFPLWSAFSRIGWGGRVDEGYQCIPMIHIDDAAAALAFLAENDSANGVYNLTIPEMVSMNELVKAFATTLSRSQHRLPKFVIRLMAGRAVKLLEQNCKVVPKRLSDSGFSFAYPNVDVIVSSLQDR